MVRPRLHNSLWLALYASGLEWSESPHAQLWLMEVFCAAWADMGWQGTAPLRWVQFSLGLQQGKEPGSRGEVPLLPCSTEPGEGRQEPPPGTSGASDVLLPPSAPCSLSLQGFPVCLFICRILAFPRSLSAAQPSFLTRVPGSCLLFPPRRMLVVWALTPLRIRAVMGSTAAQKGKGFISLCAEL